MSAAKRAVRQRFNDDCMKRDKYSCVVCGNKSQRGVEVPLEVHHITNRNEMPAGGYVKENGITLCGLCHYAAEHNVTTAPVLYRLIGSSYSKALEASERLAQRS